MARAGELLAGNRGASGGAHSTLRREHDRNGAGDRWRRTTASARTGALGVLRLLMAAADGRTPGRTPGRMDAGRNAQVSMRPMHHAPVHLCIMLRT